VTPSPTPDAYVIVHLRDALAADERVAELGIEMTVAAGTLVLTGRVSSHAQRDACTDVARANCADLQVRNDLDVVEIDAPPAAPEHLS
jgi:osmotically-inducible protein OsmY